MVGLRSGGGKRPAKVTQYIEAFKSKMVQRMVGTEGVSANRLSPDVLIGQPTLSKWVRQTEGGIGSVKLGSPPPPSRRSEDWSPEERLRIILEASRLSEEEFGAFLRREGLPEALLAERKGGAREALRPQRKPHADSRACASWRDNCVARIRRQPDDALRAVGRAPLTTGRLSGPCT